MHLQFLRRLALAAAFLTTACAHHADAQLTSAASNELPPMENGVYVAHGICIASEYGCTNEPRRATAPSELHERVDPASRVVATLAPGDLVWPIDGEYRLAPRRGVVNRAVDSYGEGQFEVGDVVYMLEPQGEGWYGLWLHGRETSSNWAEGDDNEPITWDAEPLPLPPGAITGVWTQFRLADGRTGWSDGNFECADNWCGPPDRE